ncbi:MAG: hypothetical protein ACE15C_00905 [Phycisphaerae bacterium]
MPGSQWTRGLAGLGSRPLTRRELALYAVMIAVGVTAGLVAASRLHLGMPGHKALFWMTPIVVARLLCGVRAGATAGSLAAAFTTFAAGGNFAGSFLQPLLIASAGVVLDAAAALVERSRLAGKPTQVDGNPAVGRSRVAAEGPGPGDRPRLAWYRALPIMAVGGLAANLLCMVHRLGSPAGAMRGAWGTSGLVALALSYAAFGLLAGMGGAAAACAIGRLARRWHQK